MNTRIFAVSVLALGLLAPAAFAGNNFGQSIDPANYEVSNKHGDYIAKSPAAISAEALVAPKVRSGKVHFNAGDYIDETNIERHQRSSN